MATVDDIQKQIDELLKQKSELLSKEKQSIIDELKLKIKNYEITAEDLGFTVKNDRSKKVAKTTLPPKYRNDATGDTWHGGRGAKPKWVKDIEAKGESIEKYLIKSEA